jgi:AraC-like DNA-binding protein
MAKILQKSAMLGEDARHQQLIKSGILTPAGFDDHFNVKGYTVSQDLAPFVSHYWVMRWQVPEGKRFHPVEVLSQPVAHIFITATDASVYSVINGMFDYEARGTGAIAGITFRPGGFRTFLGKSMDTLTGERMPLAAVFSENTAQIDSDILSQQDEHIVAALEKLLRTKPLQADPNVAFMGAIVDAIQADETLSTVEAVAKKFHKSERMLQHLFKSYIGVGVKWVIIRTRLLEAVKQAYAAGHPDWATITADLGYSSQAHFINDFKRVVGTSPAQFMKTIKQG